MNRVVGKRAFLIFLFAANAVFAEFNLFEFRFFANHLSFKANETGSGLGKRLELATINPDSLSVKNVFGRNLAGFPKRYTAIEEDSKKNYSYGYAFSGRIYQGDRYEIQFTDEIKSLSGQFLKPVSYSRETSVGNCDGDVYNLAYRIPFGGIGGVKTADFDLDGDMDFLHIIWSVRGGAVSEVIYDEGVGFFSREYVFASYVSDIAVGDYNGDNYPDLFVSSYTSDDNGLDLPLPNKLFLNDKTGGFVETGSYGNAISLGVVSGDFDGDGDIDIVELNREDALLLRLNDGTGRFSSQKSFLVSSRGVGFKAVDFDNDGDLDLVWRNEITMFFYQNDGQGVFSKWGEIGGTFPRWAATFGDIDQDGDLDLFIGGAQNELYLNDGGAFVKRPAASVPGRHPVSRAFFADMDNDGDEDLIVNYHFIAGSPYPDVLFNDGSGLFTKRLSLNAIQPYYMGALDYDGDGKKDLLLEGEIWLNRPCVDVAGESIMYRNDDEVTVFVSLWNYETNDATRVDVSLSLDPTWQWLDDYPNWAWSNGVLKGGATVVPSDAIVGKAFHFEISAASDIFSLDGKAMVEPFEIDVDVYDNVFPVIPLLKTTDSDGDAIPDYWEHMRGLDSESNADAEEDYDVDGFNNLEEFKANTGPFDANSYLKLKNIVKSENGHQLLIEGGEDRVFELWSCTNIVEGTWTFENSITNNPSLLLDSTNTHDACFFQLKARPE